jgi:DNA-binding NarL/FixJ family response regulator
MKKNKHNRTGIGVVDDHQLFVKSLGLLINSFDGFETVVDAVNGDQLLTKLEVLPVLPEILLVDVNMPGKDGAATTAAISGKYPLIKVIALSMNDDDLSIIGMIKAGCCAYLLKGIHPGELEKALQEVSTTGYYNADAHNINYRRLLQHSARQEEMRLSEREIQFLQLACSELTYKEIAAKLFVSERTVDGYRESVFAKMKVQSRVGMVLEALRFKIVRLDQGPSIASK